MPGFKFMSKVMKFGHSMPLRYSAMHNCLKGDANVALNKFILGLSFYLMPPHTRVRAKVHSGTDLEVQYKLLDHGLPIDDCPVDANGNLRQDILNDWFHKHLAEQGVNVEALGVDVRKSTNSQIAGSTLGVGARKPTTSQIADSTLGVDVRKPTTSRITGSTSKATPGISHPISSPPRHDILLGKGRSIQNHPGNVCFREFLKQYAEQYDATSRNQRRNVLSKIREDLNCRGIRFLQERDGKWVECFDSVADKTISQAFRNRRKQQSKKE